MSYEMSARDKAAFLLEASEWAGRIGEEEAGLVARELKTARLAAGENLFHEGEAGDFLAFVAQGRVQIVKKNAYFRKKILAELRQGHIVGEIALIDGSPRSAAAFCLTDAVFLTLNRERLDALAQRDPELGYLVLSLLSRLICRRLRETTRLYVDVDLDGVSAQSPGAAVSGGSARPWMRRYLGESPAGPVDRSDPVGAKIPGEPGNPDGAKA